VRRFSGQGVRASFEEAERQGWPWKARIRKLAAAPAGYTPNTLVTEWLTLHCIGPWASKRRAGWVEVRFLREDDRRRAAAHFAALGQLG
jgi:hypothetical protein